MYPQVSRTLLSILADLNNALVCMVSFLYLISYCSNPLSQHLGANLSVAATICIAVSSIFHSFFISLLRSITCLSFCFVLFFCLFVVFFLFLLCHARSAKSTRRQVFTLVGGIISSRSGLRLQAEIVSSVCISFGLYKYHLAVWSQCNLSHSSQLISFPTQLFLVSYFLFYFAAFNYIVTVSSFSLHNLHLLFCCFLSIFALT